MTQRHKVSKCCWENGTDRLTRGRVATNLQFVKNAVSAKHNKAKHNKRRSACTQISKRKKILKKDLSVNVWSLKPEITLGISNREGFNIGN